MPLIVALTTLAVVLIALLGWYIPKIVRLAKGRGIGVLRPGLLLIGLDPPAPGEAQLRLAATLRPWRTAPPRVRPGLALLIPAVWLARRFGRQPAGYLGLLGASGTSPALTGRWTPALPKASIAWWRKGRVPALGVISLPEAGQLAAPQAWERLLTELGGEAAGRIEWIRLVSGVALPEADSATMPSSYSGEAAPRLPPTPGPALGRAAYARGAMLLAPTAWQRALREFYDQPEPSGARPMVRHVIGRAIVTSAGPAMDVSDGVAAESGPGEQRLLDVTELKSGSPDMVILQAEPVSVDPADLRLSDEHAERLQLGAALAGDGVPAVFLLPALPADTTAEVARLITAHARGLPGQDAQVLLTGLRKTIEQVTPRSLDDVVLFLSRARYRS